MAYNTYHSRLIPYEKEIVTLRRQKPPMPYARIAELLMEKYNLSIQAPAIFKFIKVRSKGYKTCKYAWAIELPESDDERIPRIAAGYPATSNFQRAGFRDIFNNFSEHFRGKFYKRQPGLPGSVIRDTIPWASGLRFR